MGQAAELFGDVCATSAEAEGWAGELAKLEAEGEGELVALMKYVLGVHEISIQRYWNGALVGPNCRTLLEKHGETLRAIRQGIVAAGYGDADAKASCTGTRPC